jgi:hypothetical protein
VHLREARRPAERPGAAGAVEMRRGGQSSWRRGSRTPMRSLGRHGARARRRTTRVCCSPPGAAPERLPDGETAATVRIRRRRRLGFAGGAWAGEGGSGGGTPGAARGLNSPGTVP